MKRFKSGDRIILIDGELKGCKGKFGYYSKVIDNKSRVYLDDASNSHMANRLIGLTKPRIGYSILVYTEYIRYENNTICNSCINGCKSGDIDDCDFYEYEGE